MSDALSDIARDEERGRRFYEFVKKTISFLKDEISKDEYIECAKKVDYVGKGYWNSRTRLCEKLEKLLPLENDRQKWAEFLSIFASESHQFSKIKELSPFKDEIFIFVNYGYGFTYYYGDIDNLIKEILKVGNFSLYPGKDFVVTFSKPKVEEVSSYLIRDYLTSEPQRMQENTWKPKLLR